MPLKIRCPHCKKVLLAEDDTAGQFKLCPACSNILHVPKPRRIQDAPLVDVTWTCPNCQRLVAPGTTYCTHCHYDRASEKRLPLRRRMELMSLRSRLVVGLGGLVLVLALIVSAELLWQKSRRTAPTSQAVVSLGPSSEERRSLAESLLKASSLSERRTAVAELTRLGTDAYAAVAAALQETLSRPDAPPLRWNQQAGIELLALSRDPKWIPLLRSYGPRNGTIDATLRARGLLGDAEALDGLVRRWLDLFERQLFLRALAQSAPGAWERAARAEALRTELGAAGMAEALRELGGAPDIDVFERLAPTYWQSWSWLGQERGESFAAALFDLSKPAGQKDLDFEEAKTGIRAARRGLESAAQRGSPTVKAAAGIVLVERAPQYTSLKERIIRDLVATLPEIPPAEQQRVAWALARMTGLTFGRASPRSMPQDVGPEEVDAIVAWSKAAGGQSKSVTPRSSRSGFVPPPVLTVRVVSPRRLLEVALVDELRSGWDGLDGRVGEWIAADLGCTSRLRELLHPGQRNPNLPALAAAMIITADCADQGAREPLELWSRASDQANWVRALARTVLGALDARAGLPQNSWPDSVQPDWLLALDHEPPGWDVFGRVVSAGGPKMLSRLRERGPAALGPQLTARLVSAAERASQRRPRPEP